MFKIQKYVNPPWRRNPSKAPGGCPRKQSNRNQLSCEMGRHLQRIDDRVNVTSISKHQTTLWNKYKGILKKLVCYWHFCCPTKKTRITTRYSCNCITIVYQAIYWWVVKLKFFTFKDISCFSAQVVRGLTFLECHATDIYIKVLYIKIN